MLATVLNGSLGSLGSLRTVKSENRILMFLLLLSRIKKRKGKRKHICVCHPCTQHAHKSIPDALHVRIKDNIGALFEQTSSISLFSTTNHPMWVLPPDAWTDCNFDVPNAAFPSRGTYIVTAMSRGNCCDETPCATNTTTMGNMVGIMLLFLVMCLLQKRKNFFFEKRLNLER